MCFQRRAVHKVLTTCQNVQEVHADVEQDVSGHRARPSAWLCTLRRTGAWLLLAMGILQFVAGIAVTFLPPM